MLKRKPNVFLKNVGLNSFNDLLKFITSSECSDELAITAEAVLDRLRCASPKRKTILTSSIEVGTYLADRAQAGRIVGIVY